MKKDCLKSNFFSSGSSFMKNGKTSSAAGGGQLRQATGMFNDFNFSWMRIRLYIYYCR